VIDSFIQPNKLESLDILIALDTSGSMLDNYEDVANGMELLRGDIESLTFDYQFGYITMDPTNLSYLGPYDSSSTAIDMLMAPNLLPTTHLEEGFASTYSFFSSGEGWAFKRPEADLLLFLISDEDEQSAITAPLFQEWLQDEFKHVNHDVVCVVIPDDGSGGSWTYDIGYKYIELSSLYGKDIVDIQQDDWSSWLSSSSYLTRMIDYIELSQVPIQDSIVVYVNGTPIHDWTYNEHSNIVFLSSPPDYGSLVEVGYEVESR
tara:strand:- start:432 stop:1217 length:786 start_codon:yes stop_codon:yes gene_type:complete